MIKDRDEVVAKLIEIQYDLSLIHIQMCIRDSCKDIDALKRAIDYGYSSVMYDGSALPLEERCV